MTNKARLSPSQVARELRNDPDIKKMVNIFDEESTKIYPHDDDLKKAAQNFIDKVNGCINALEYNGVFLNAGCTGQYNYAHKGQLEFHATLFASNKTKAVFKFFKLSNKDDVFTQAQNGGRIIDANDDDELKLYISSHLETLVREVAQSHAKGKHFIRRR